MKWKYESVNTAEYLSLHDCECSKILGRNNNLIMYMEWMEVLSEHPDNPYKEAHQSGEGMVEFIECEDVLLEIVGEDNLIIKSIDGIDFKDYEILDFEIEKAKEGYHAKIFMIEWDPSKSISIDMLFRSSITRFNELNDISWFVKER